LPHFSATYILTALKKTDATTDDSLARQTRERPSRRAILLDRDGTLNQEVGYLRTVGDLRLFADVPAALRQINAAGWLAIVLTNQSGVARGLFPESVIGEIHAEMQRRLALSGAHVDAFYHCPHLPPAGAPDGELKPELARYRVACDCRKPAPGLIWRAAREWNLDLARSVVIGDRYRDVEMGHRAGARGVLVLTGYGAEELRNRADWPRQPEFIAADLQSAVEWVFRSEV
jgi:D-glycero-D-manno-heptose 1,7-bisphosphate phosphatase